MYVIRRVWESKPGEARRAATLAAKIGQVYEEAEQRSPVQISFNGGTLPGETNRVVMQWTAENIESPYRGGNVIPEGTRQFGAAMRDITVRSWVEMEELLTPDKWQE